MASECPPPGDEQLTGMRITCARTPTPSEAHDLTIALAAAVFSAADYADELWPSGWRLDTSDQFARAGRYPLNHALRTRCSFLSPWTDGE